MMTGKVCTNSDLLDDRNISSRILYGHDERKRATISTRFTTEKLQIVGDEKSSLALNISENLKPTHEEQQAGEHGNEKVEDFHLLQVRKLSNGCSASP